jgi:hypothetical protein
MNMEQEYYLGESVRFSCSCCLCWFGLGDRGNSVQVGCPEGWGTKKLFVATFSADVGRVAFLGVPVACPVEFLFRLRTSLKPFPCFVSPACPLAFRTYFSSVSVTVYVLYSALNSVLTRRALQ